MRQTLVIDPQLCMSCAVCAARRTCRTRAIVQIERGELPAIEDSRCLGCKACVPACPNQAIRFPALKSEIASLRPANSGPDSVRNDMA